MQRWFMFGFPWSFDVKHVFHVNSNASHVQYCFMKPRCCLHDGEVAVPFVHSLGKISVENRLGSKGPAF